MKRDQQKQAVYDWETQNVAPYDRTVVPFAQIESIVHHIWASEGLEYPPLVVQLSANAKLAGMGNRTMVHFPTQTYTWIILHELSHSMTGLCDGKTNESVFEFAVACAVRVGRESWIAGKAGCQAIIFGVIMPHCYEYPGPRMAMQDDIFTGTKQGDCIPSCIQVDSDHGTHAALLRVPVYHHKRAGCKDVYELFLLIEELVNFPVHCWGKETRT